MSEDTQKPVDPKYDDHNLPPGTKVEWVRTKPPAIDPDLVAGISYGTGDDSPQISDGTTLTIIAGSTTVVPIKVTKITLPTVSGGDVDITGMSDTYEVKMPGMIKPGDAEVDVIYLKTQSNDLYNCLNTPGTIHVTTPDSNTYSFPGWINSWGGEFPAPNQKIGNKLKITANAPMDISGG